MTDESDKNKFDANVKLDKKQSIEVKQSGKGTFYIKSGFVVLESESFMAGAEITGDNTDLKFSIGLAANIDEAVEYAIEYLISRGHLSLDTDFWIDNFNLVLKDVFDQKLEANSPQYFLKKAVEEKKILIDGFNGEIEIPNPFTNALIIFSELEKILCENQKILTAEWYTTKILLEYANKKAIRNEFLIGTLWEQLRVKVNYEEQFKKQEATNERLKLQSSQATEILVEKSRKWKQHALKEARKIIKEEPWMMGRWSELANSILDEIEACTANSTLREIYRGKTSKSKPLGSNLIGTQTISKYLSNELRH